MNGCEFDKTCETDPGEALSSAADHLIKIGYVLKKREEDRVHLKFEGKLLGKRAEDITHHLYIVAKPGRLHFEFTTGFVASYWTERDRAFADHRAESAAEAARARGRKGDPPASPASPGQQPAPDGMTRCMYCGKLNVARASECVTCGAGVFC